MRPPTSATLIRPDQPLPRLGPGTLQIPVPLPATLIRPDQPSCPASPIKIG
jgi:hypothetical protein